MISRYSDLYTQLQVDLPGIETPYLLHMLQKAGREFCIRSEAWREKLTFNVVDADAAGDAAYDAAIALGQSTAAADEAYDIAYDAALEYTLEPHYDAEVIRPWKVWINGDEDETPYESRNYTFDPATSKLRMLSQVQTYSPTATAWATSTAYTAGKYVTSTTTNRRYLCAIDHTSGTWATDLAANYWKVMHDDLIVKVVLVPRLNCIELAGWFMEKWAEAIVARCKVMCMVEPNKSWSRPDLVGYFQQEYDARIRVALREKLAEDKHTDILIETPPWIP